MGLVGGHESREGKKSEKIEERYGVVWERERSERRKKIMEIIIIIIYDII